MANWFGLLKPPMKDSTNLHLQVAFKGLPTEGPIPSNAIDPSPSRTGTASVQSRRYSISSPKVWLVLHSSILPGPIGKRASKVAVRCRYILGLLNKREDDVHWIASAPSLDCLFPFIVA